jgi:integrase
LWLLRYRRPGTGKENFLSLGPYPDISLTDARKAAAVARNLIREGTDPVEHRKAESAARKRAAEGAFYLVAENWLAFKRKEWADETYRKADFVVRQYLVPPLRNKPISTLATSEVKPAIHHSLREDGVPLSLRGVIPRHKKGHIPAITKPAEIVPLVQAINTYQSPITRAALKLTMLTGLRPGVVATAPWHEINLEAGEWHVTASRMKMRHDHIVPLPRQAVALLNELQSFTGRGHYVFPSPARQKTPHLHRDALSKALRDMGFKGKHAAHGFRGMLRTVGRERLGIDIDILEAQLAHAKRGDVQKAYDRTTFDDDRRRVMTSVQRGACAWTNCFSWWRRVTHENVDLAQAGHRRRENHTGGRVMNARASLTARLMSACAWCDALLDLSRTEGLTWIYILKTVGAALLSLGIAMKLEFVNGFNAQMTAVFAG